MIVTRPVLVLQHATWERPGLVARALASRDIPWESRIVLDQASPDLPAVDELGGLVVLGGSMGALDDTAYPGLAAERRLLADATAAGVPVLGICLGMQLLAVALGAELLVDHGTELGVAPVAMTGAGLRDQLLYPLAVDASPDPEVLHWHSDGVTVPPGATILASSDRTPVQAFRHGNALGLQFHLEVDGPLLAEWLAEPAMVDGLSLADTAQLARDCAARFPSLVPRALVVFGAFADEVAARRK